MATIIVPTTTNGYLSGYGEGVSYATVYSAANGEVTQDGDLIDVGQYYYAPDTAFGIYRSALDFGTMTVTATAATLSLWLNTDNSTTDFNIVLVSGSDLASILVEADYGDLLDDITALNDDFNTSSLVAGWNVLTFNAAGITILNGGGTIRLGGRSSRDISSTTPKLNGASASEEVSFHAKTIGGNNHTPFLTITYTPSAFTPKIFYF